MLSSVFAQANAIVESLCNNMAVQYQTLIQTIVEIGSSPTTEKGPEPVVNDVTQLAILEALKKLQIVMEESTTKEKRNDGSRNACLKHYYWLQGKCNHKLSDCKDKNDGHKDNATLNNKQGSSTKNCNSKGAWWCGLERNV